MRIADLAVGCPMCEPGKVLVGRKPGCPKGMEVS